jgi:MFS family permease
VWSGSDTVLLPLAGSVATWRAVFLVAGLPGFAVALLLLFVREPARQAARTAPTAARTGDFAGHLRRNWRLFVPLYLGFSLVFFFSYAVALWSPTVLARTYGYTPGHAGVTAGSFQLVGSVAGALLAGVFGDILVARDARYGRLRVWLVGLVPALAAAVFLALPGARFYVVGICLAIFASGLLTAASFATLYDAVAPNMRGRSLAVYLFLGNVLGLGGGAFGVAMITEHVLGEARLINYAVAIAVGAAAVVATLMGFLMRERYEDARLTYRQENAGATVAAPGKHS